MKYLFFDIECSNCLNYVGKMCEFGYVLTDENLKILDKDDIPMSPGKGFRNKFHLVGRKGQRDLILAYDYEFYYSQPEFPYFYERIRKLVEDEDTICFAYSMDNDIPHLFHSCTRYNKRPFSYKCYDVQKLAGKFLETKKQTSLKAACHNIVGPNSTVNLQEHLSRDDAMMEYMIFEAICELTKLSSKELLEESEYASTNSLDYMKSLEEKSKIKSRRANAIRLYDKHVASNEILNDEQYKGKRYLVSKNIKENFDLLKKVIEYVSSNGGVFTHHLDTCDIFVVETDLDIAKRKEALKDTYKGIFVKVEEII